MPSCPAASPRSPGRRWSGRRLRITETDSLDPRASNPLSSVLRLRPHLRVLVFDSGVYRMPAKRQRPRRKSASRSKVYDMALIQRGARLRRSPFFDSTLKAGCKSYTVYNHTFLPSYYDDPVTEYWHLIEHVAIWDVGVERQVEISGPDALTLTQRLTPRDLSRCAVGQGKYVLITADDGGVINDPVLLRLAEDRFWLSLAGSDVLLWAGGVAINAGLNVEIVEPDVWPLQLQGPKSKALVADLFGDPVASMPYYAFS